MLHRLRVAAAALLMTFAASVVARAALPTFWQVSTEAEFLKGEVENLSIDSYGRLTLGPATTPLYESNAPFLWTLLAAPDGNIYAGSGNEGQVFRITPDGKSSVFFDSAELEVHALAAAPGGGLYVATSPDGKIYKLDAAGKATTFFDPPDRYIWSLAIDRSGNVFAATGDKGVIYKIAPDGKGAPFYQTKATNAVSLAFDGRGRLLAGTESPGRVFQIDPSGKPFVLLDSNYNEIHQLRVDANGVIYAAAVRGRAEAPAQSSQPDQPADTSTQTPIASVSTEITAIAIVDSTAVSGTSSGAPAPTTPRTPGAGAIYRISSDGTSDIVWESHDDSPYDIAFEPGGSLLVATGNKGKIYRLSGDPYQPTLVTRANAEQVTTLGLARDGRVVFATSNPGKVFRLSADRADRGTYTSDVRDATTVAAWGALKWQAAVPSGTKVEIETRSGNTRTPDETWSDWSAPYTASEGSAITSPRARFLQWRAVFTGARNEAPLLTSVTAAYLPRNLRPRVTSITIHPPGTVFQRPFPTDPEIAGFEGDTPDRRATAQAQGNPNNTAANIGRRGYEKGLLTFVWHAEDDNKDELSYEVQYRREGETSWKVLKRGLTDPILVWDTTSVPNGRYILRVVASDAPSNSPSTALTGLMESTAFEIDNAPPIITVTSVRRDGNRTIIDFDVRDEQSAVQKADYSLDGNRWQTIYPKDGIADSRFERYELVLEGDTARGVIVRATDALNNVSSASAEMPTPPAPSGRR
ncbi:MAG TPA: SMP-30/gluconolactonase/LRE family protein [Vicinamibacterales bacterium]|nr:SMP-30/gluconolactonase/LRE family protein [Vicinamibacterales bacterium]